jgi:Polyketide cyclase / dehydrase and lipid transport
MPAVNPDIAFCLQRIGQDRAGWDTLVVSGAADTPVAAEVVWARWTDLERWPVWSPLHRSVTRARTAELAAGATFDQQLSLGFPIGTTRQHVTIDLLEPARRASWSGDSNGIKSCHLWSFTPFPDGGTHVSRSAARYARDLPVIWWPTCRIQSGHFAGKHRNRGLSGPTTLNPSDLGRHPSARCERRAGRPPAAASRSGRLH